MNPAPRLAILLALQLLLLGGSAATADGIKTAQGSADTEIGTGLVCDTQEQVEQFVSLYDGDTSGTAKKVNDAVGDPTACAILPIAYVRGRPLATTRHNDTTFQIVRILVLGLVTKAGVESVAPATYFSAIPIEEIGV